MGFRYRHHPHLTARGIGKAGMGGGGRRWKGVEQGGERWKEEGRGGEGGAVEGGR